MTALQSASEAAAWEHFAHGADIGIRGIGATVEEAFEQAALAMIAVITDPANVNLQTDIEINCEAPELDLLLLDWLNALVLKMATDNLVFGSFTVSISGPRVARGPAGRRARRAHRYRAPSAYRRGQGSNAYRALSCTR